MFGELQHRQRVLGDAYPFAVNRRPLGLVRVDGSTSVPGRVIYLFCLLASAIRENRFQPATVTQSAASGIANLFQVCACLAAGGYTAGEVVSFGFPRPTGTGFLSALRAGYERFGAGSVRNEVPPGFPVSAKDEGIDVIAWRDHPDRMPGKLYLLGQSASGVDWEEKSVVDRVEQFHGWFTQPPARHWLPSMFIPFTLHRDLSDDPMVAFEEMLANKCLRQEARYGIVFDRDRVTAGYVVDFVDVYWRGWHFWAFNVADAAITVGACLLILDTAILNRTWRGRDETSAAFHLSVLCDVP